MISRFPLFVLTLLVAVMPVQAQRLSALAPPPDWSQLEAFQESITHDDFVRLLDRVYAPAGAAKGVIDVEADAAVIKTTLTPPTEFRLRFAKDAAAAKAAPRYWRTPAQLGVAPEGQPLAGLKISLDPGHLGGTWAEMEERYFQIGESRPVTEGDMALRVAKMVVPKLQALGAQVSLVRGGAEPVTKERPETLRDAARAELAKEGVTSPKENYNGMNDPGRGSTVQAQSELLFYRISEIRARATLVNAQLKPDLVVCLHFNADSWGDPLHPEFVPRNHLHVIVNGCYSAGELHLDDQRLEMLEKLLSGAFPEELAASESVANALAAATKLPPYSYTTGNAVRAADNPYVWARNLLANRLYHAPVVFLEPYVMNSEVVWERVQAGDYEGEQMIGGEMRPSIFREYADAVVAGLRDHYAKARAPQPAPAAAPASPPPAAPK
ncbi:MAG: N-acetylmuramoyl-L-alanine amidase [Chthoniobacter sp.]|nr:N-acetylmuramoyl-L-alanine amidase [Chthoniobacter sp.]